MMPRPLTRRKKQLIFTIIGSAIFVILIAGVILWTRPRNEVYRPGEKIEGITDSLGRELPADYPHIHFTDVTKAAGIDFRHFYGERSTQLPEDMGSGAAWGDYNNDGWVDLYIVNIAGPLTLSPDESARSPASNRLYKNNGDGTFADVTEAARVGNRGCGMGAAWGDYDNDGDLDLIVTNYGTNLLYRNDGVGVFTEVGRSAGIGGVEGFWTGASWADYDNDGYLDLYICGYVQYKFDPADVTRTSQQYEAVTPATLNPSSYPPERNLLYHNNGNGTFTEVAQKAGVDNAAGRSFSASWCDFNNDGWVDLYVANDVSDNVMYRNNGDRTFTDVSHEAWVADYRGAMGLATGDWDNDGDMDIFVTHWIAQENALYKNLLTELSQMPASTNLQMSKSANEPVEGNPQSKSPFTRFTDMADAYGLGQIALDFIGWGTAFFDYDNDGRLDIFVVNGSTFQKPDNPKLLIPMRNQLFWNNGDAGFFEVGSVSGDVFKEEWVGRGAAFADYDNDGDVDVFIVNHGAPPKLLQNDGGNVNRWFKVRLKGTKSNRFGVGSKLAIVAGGERQIREIGAGSSYLSQNALEAAFGCKGMAEITSLKIVWPSGTTQELTSIPTNQIIEVTEGKGWQTVETKTGKPESRRARKPEDLPIGQTPDTIDIAHGRQYTRPNPKLTREQTTQFWDAYRRAINIMKTEKDWDKSAALFREALAIDPNHEDSIYYLGNCLFELGDYPGALAQFQRLVEINSHSLRGNLQIGAVYACPDSGKLFNLDSAEHALQQALAINPEESGSLLQLGAVALAKGNLEGASKYFSMARQLNFKAVDAYYLDGYIQWKRGEVDAATTLFHKAIEYSHAPPPPSAPPESGTKGKEQGATSPPHILGEGDTKRADRGALTSTTVHQRRLFGEQLDALKKRDASEVITKKNVIEEYQRLGQYLAKLK